jgi:hypothetical protein
MVNSLDLYPGLLMLNLHYVVCASLIKRLPWIYGYLNLFSDTLDFKKFLNSIFRKVPLLFLLRNVTVTINVAI